MPLAKFIDCILIETKSKGENSLEKFLKSEYKNLVLEYFKSDEYRRKVGDRPHLNKFHEFLLNATEPEISDQSITSKAYVKVFINVYLKKFNFSFEKLNFLK